MSNELALQRLTIFDTTLRDGEQAPGNSMTVQQKVEIARGLERLGVDVIETGFPAASDNDFQTTVELASSIRSAKLCAFARAAKSDISQAFNAVKNAKRFQIEILAAASDIHLNHKRHLSRAAALQEASEAVTYARSLGAEDVCIVPEDATRADREFLRQLIENCREAGATMAGIPDTVGAAIPDEYYDLIGEVRSWVGKEFPIAVHTHDDLGLAVANTLAGIEAGANECQVTLCGIGERAGNAALEEVVAAVVSKQSHFQRSVSIDTTKIADTCQLLVDTLRLSLPSAKAVIGENAFATAAGIHQAGILEEPRTYEFLKPETFGRTRRLVIARHSGRHALSARLASLGLHPDPPLLNRAYQILVENGQSIYSDADLLRLVEMTQMASQGT